MSMVKAAKQKMRAMNPVIQIIIATMSLVIFFLVVSFVVAMFSILTGVDFKNAFVVALIAGWVAGLAATSFYLGTILR